MKTERDDGGPAFPWGEQGVRIGGMSLRDYFAAQALAGLAAHGPHPDLVRMTEAELAATFATAAYNMADAMLAARNRGQS